MRQLTLFIIGAVALTLLSCGGEETRRTAHIKGMEMDSVVADSTLHLDAASASPACHIRLSMQYVKEGKHADAINDTLIRCGILAPDYFSLGDKRVTMKEAADSFVARYMAEYKEEYGALYRQDRGHASSYDCRFLLNTLTREGADGVLNYIANITYYGGGAHDIRQTIVKNFRVKDGHLLSLDDLFDADDWRDKLKAIIVDKLCDQMDAKNLKELSDQGVFSDGQAYVTDNFLLDEGTVTFIYGEDEIAPHDAGEIRVRVKLSEVE